MITNFLMPKSGRNGFVYLRSLVLCEAQAPRYRKMLQIACLNYYPNLAFASQCTIRSLYTPTSGSHGTRIRAKFNALDSPIAEQANEDTRPAEANSPPAIDKEIKKVVQKTAATFAPRASTAQKNPAVPGTVLYTVFEVQGYLSMMLGGALAFNIVLPSSEPDIWRLMGMWSIWMFTIPSLRARDCSNKEKEALNYLFLLLPLLNIILPVFWKSFSVVWSADTLAFFLIYAWKLEWLQKVE